MITGIQSLEIFTGKGEAYYLTPFKKGVAVIGKHPIPLSST
jgi:hypothetical protein